MANFDSLGLSAALLHALRDQGYSVPTSIQVQAIPPILAARDVLGCAQTGTGKTAAFALPILHRLAAASDLSRRGPSLPRALVLAPTRELAVQIGDAFAAYGRHTHLRHTVVYGGVSQFHQVRALERGVDILIATPGRLIDLMQQRLVNLNDVQILVLDEADRMLDMGFIDPIRRITAALPASNPRQTLLFSATMPRAVVHLVESLLKEPVRITVTPVASAAPKIRQSVYLVPRAKKQALLKHLLAEKQVERALVFTRTKHGADRLSRDLNRGGLSTDAIHGNKAQNQRRRALDGFRSGATRVLVATDVAARGIDVDGITHVFNYDMPIEPENYVHRIGRTGRAGAAGVAVSLCDSDEQGLLRDIERLIGDRVPQVRDLPKLPRVDQSHSASMTGARPRQATGAHGGNTGQPARPSAHTSTGRGKFHHAAPGRRGERTGGRRSRRGVVRARTTT